MANIKYLSNTDATKVAQTEGEDLYGRVGKLLVSTATGKGLDLSELHFKFVVKRSDTMTPNVADIRVYNLSEETAVLIRKEFTKVTLEAGYTGNSGVIFQGNIKQVILGRESGTDTFIDIVAGDGDRAYNFAIVNTTLAKGSTLLDQIKAATTEMLPKGVSQGHLSLMPTIQLPRAKVMFGPAKDILRNVAQNSGSSWSIQDEKVTFVAKKAYLPGQRVVLTSKTGMIGTPQQTNEGVNVKCLLNPFIRIAGQLVIDNKSVEQLKINLSIPLSPANIPAPLTADGTYYVLVAEHIGDNRGTDWYTNNICLNIDVTSNPINSVQVGYSGG